MDNVKKDCNINWSKVKRISITDESLIEKYLDGTVTEIEMSAIWDNGTITRCSKGPIEYYILPPSKQNKLI